MRRVILLAVTAFFVFAGVATAAAVPKLQDVNPWEYDPYFGSLVEADWVNHIGCPTGAAINTYDANGNVVAGTFTAGGCPTQYRADRNVQGLMLAKTGPTANLASAGASLRGMQGGPLTEIGYDIRKQGGFASPYGSHCGAGAPRFNVVTAFGTHFIGCASPAPTQIAMGDGWTRLAWTPDQAFPPIPAGAVIQSIDLVMDEGTDVGPDHFGIAILDNIMVNGVSVGHRS